MAKGGTFCGKKLAEWLQAAGAKPEDIWDASLPEAQRSLWEARVFPAETKHGAYRDWLWMFVPEQASPDQKQSFLDADRYSAAEIAILASQEEFFTRRLRSRAESLPPMLHSLFQRDSRFSAQDFTWLLRQTGRRNECITGLLAEARSYAGSANSAPDLENFQSSRVLHSVATAVEQLADNPTVSLGKVLPGLQSAVASDLGEWLGSHGLEVIDSASASAWAQRAKETAFTQINQTILRSAMHEVEPPRNALRRDETVWGRAPARIELGGGWTDTPPYTLEFGGEVINTAINLNGQPPIPC